MLNIEVIICMYKILNINVIICVYVCIVKWCARKKGTIYKN